jgi:hypothetical protein
MAALLIFSIFMLLLLTEWDEFPTRRQKFRDGFQTTSFNSPGTVSNPTDGLETRATNRRLLMRVMSNAFGSRKFRVVAPLASMAYTRQGQ